MRWKLKRRTVVFDGRSMIMGIVNVTPDSFSDGGSFLNTEDAVTHALSLIAQGAGIIDVGGESTRPGAAPVSCETEFARVVPVIQELVRVRPGVLVSIDTTKAAVAAAAIEAGAEIINDVSAMRADLCMGKVAAETGAGVILMHMQGTPQTMQHEPHYNDVVGEVREFLEGQSRFAESAGIDPEALAFDPGIGFGKTVTHNLALLRNVDKTCPSGRPLVVGVSRKSFLGRIIGSDRMEDREWPTVALSAILRRKGVDVLRVHDVSANLQSVKMTEAILAA